MDDQEDDPSWNAMAKEIRKNGWAVTFILPRDDLPSYAHTVGMSYSGRPELLVIGLNLEDAQVLLNGCAALLMKGAILPAQHAKIDTLTHQPIALRKDDPYGSMAAISKSAVIWAEETKAPELEFLQIVIPDSNGLFPWEEGCQPSAARAQDPSEIARILYMRMDAAENDTTYPTHRLQ